jgi:predicted nucleic acid-binding protein
VAADRPLYLVDTNVLSNRTDARADPNVSIWLQRFGGRIRLSVVTVAEMHRGLLLLQARAGETADRKARTRLEVALRAKRKWYDTLLEVFADRLEPIDLPVARKWAEVSVRFPSLRDGDKAIAATALAKGYGVATRNLGDFRQTGVKLVNPFDPGTWDLEDDLDPIARLLPQ